MLIFTILLDGIAYGMVLFIISVGLTVTMGLMRVVNLAHGAFAMLGGYLSSVMIRHYGVPFVFSALLSGAACGALGAIMELTIYRQLYRKGELQQVLLTFGLIFISIASMSLLFGAAPIAESMPRWLEGQIDLGFRTYPAYRLFLIGVGVLMAIGLALLIERSLFGARLRAAVDDPGMARAIGINVNLLFTLTFIGAGILPIEPFYALRYLVLFLVVVSIGGLGSFRGSLLAALVVGIIETTGKYLVPQLGSFLLWFIVFGLLLWRPNGLLPSKSAS